MTKTQSVSFSVNHFFKCCFFGFFLLLVGCAQKLPMPEQDSAPKHIPKNLDRVADPIPKVEPLSRYGNRFKNSNSYVALKKRYHVMPTSRGYRAEGMASWYGTKFHGKRTSSGEPYNMYQMTAAHRTLPLPTYARVTNMNNGKSVIVKVNDRGPFHNNRLIDLSYVAAHKLGILGKGTGQVRVESVDPRDHHGKIPKLKQKRGQFSQMAQSTQNIQDMQNLQATKNIQATQNQQAAQNKSTRKPQLYLQMGAFNKRSGAETLLNDIMRSSSYAGAITTENKNNKSLYKVRLGPFESEEKLKQATKVLATAKFGTPIRLKE